MMTAMSLILLAAVGGLGVQLHRERQRHRQQLADSDRLCSAIGRIESGDFSDVPLDLESEPLARVGSAYEKMLPAVRTTIEELEWHARHDSLSSALNARSFKQHCQAELNREADSALIGGALLFIDINDFKKINDSLGHEAGDRFLIMCADRIRLACASFKSSRLAAFLAGADIDSYQPAVGRLGGDEFGIFLPGNPGYDDVQRFVQRLSRLIAEPFQIGAHALSAKISVGIAFSRDHHNAFEKLLAAADTAMYEAKNNGGPGYCYYDEAMRKRADEILERELDIRRAIQQSQFKLFFQPQVNLTTNRIESAEALIRWDHPERGMVGPDEFIPFAEKYNLIDDLGDWVLAEAVATVARWRKAGRDLRISINVSPKQLNRVELIPLIRALLEYHQLPGEALEIEITEAALVSSDDIPLERIKGLRQDGVAIALDDFGTGYSNLAQLMCLPLDRLKLDRSLLQPGVTQKQSLTVVAAVTQLARKLGFEIVAEGVESDEQLAFLRKARCNLVQGFLFAPPLPESAFLELCDHHAGIQEKREAA